MGHLRRLQINIMVCVSGRSVFFENQFYFYFELEYSKIHFFQNRDLTWYATCSKMIVTNKQECLLCFNGNVSNRNVVDNDLYYLNMHFLPNRWNRWEETHKMAYWTFLSFLFGKTVVWVSCPSDEPSCKKSRKSLEPFLR